MPIPDFQSILLPLLKLTASRNELSTSESYQRMAEHFGLTPQDIAQPMPSGKGTLFRNRVAWAKQYLMYANLVEPTKRGVSRVSELGAQWARERSKPLKIREFETIPGFVERVHGARGERQETEGIEGVGIPKEASAAAGLSQTADERLELAHAELVQRTIQTLLLKIRSKPPEFFEQLVIALMSKLGYGDGTEESMLHSGGSGDGGIDGRIKMDVLGLEHVFLQAKRYEDGNVISREQVAAFAGSIAGAKGVFVTTSTFSKQATDFARLSHKNIVLVDGRALGALMLRSGLGVSAKKIFEVHSIDEDFFSDEE
jgi:restriction system protein